MFHKLHVLGMNDALWEKVRGLGSETWKGCELVGLLVVLTRLRGTGESNARESDCSKCLVRGKSIILTDNT